MRIYCYVDLFRIDGPIAIKYHGLNESARWKLTKDTLKLLLISEEWEKKLKRVHFIFCFETGL